MSERFEIEKMRGEDRLAQQVPLTLISHREAWNMYLSRGGEELAGNYALLTWCVATAVM
jgi:hypothetical protein